MKLHPSDWHWCITCHDSLWKLDLPQQSLLAYVYLSSHCLGKHFPISIIKMAKVLRMDTKRLKAAIDELLLRTMVEKRNRIGSASTYMVITRRSKTWGQTPLPLGANAPTPLGENAPTTWGQTPLLTTNLDTEFLSLAHTALKCWTFNKKPVGRNFVFTRGMQSKALEMMRWLHHNREGFGTREAFGRFLTSCSEYLAHDRDVLSPSRDQRALSPAKWLYDWPEQIRLVGIYIDEQERKITRMPLNTEEIL